MPNKFVSFIAEFVAVGLRERFFGYSAPGTPERIKEDNIIRFTHEASASLTKRLEALKQSGQAGTLAVDSRDCNYLLYALEILEEHDLLQINVRHFLQRLGLMQAKIWNGEDVKSAVRDLGLNAKRNGMTPELLRNIYKALKHDLLNIVDLPTAAGTTTRSPFCVETLSSGFWGDSNTPCRDYLTVNAMKEIFGGRSVEAMAKKLKACGITEASDAIRDEELANWVDDITA